MAPAACGPGLCSDSSGASSLQPPGPPALSGVAGAPSASLGAWRSWTRLRVTYRETEVGGWVGTLEVGRGGEKGRTLGALTRWWFFTPGKPSGGGKGRTVTLEEQRRKWSLPTDRVIWGVEGGVGVSSLSFNTRSAYCLPGTSQMLTHLLLRTTPQTPFYSGGRRATGYLVSSRTWTLPRVAQLSCGLPSLLIGWVEDAGGRQVYTLSVYGLLLHSLAHSFTQQILVWGFLLPRCGACTWATMVSEASHSPCLCGAGEGDGD